MFAATDISNDSFLTIRGRGINDVSGVIFSDDFTNRFFTPVIVRPSDEDIENATTTVFYDPDDHSQTTDPIDQSDFEDGEILTRIDYCGHMFREDNIRIWFRSSVFCPLCRHDIREIEDSPTEA